MLASLASVLASHGAGNGSNVRRESVSKIGDIMAKFNMPSTDALNAAKTALATIAGLASTLGAAEYDTEGKNRVADASDLHSLYQRAVRVVRQANVANAANKVEIKVNDKMIAESSRAERAALKALPPEQRAVFAGLLKLPTEIKVAIEDFASCFAEGTTIETMSDALTMMGYSVTGVKGAGNAGKKVVVLPVVEPKATESSARKVG